MAQESNTKRSINSQLTVSDGEIELFDLLVVIWKWKYFILAGTLLCVIAAGAISMNQTKKYRLTAILKLNPIRAVDKNKENENTNDNNNSGNVFFFIESPQNIKYLIERGALNDQIKAHLKKGANASDLNIPNIKVGAQGAGNLLQISVDTTDSQLGEAILNSLKPVLMQKFEKQTSLIERNYGADILAIQNEIAAFKAQRKLVEMDIHKISQRINELQTEIKDLKMITDLMMIQRNQVFNTNKNDVIAPEILYRNMIQQNMGLTTIFKGSLFELISKVDHQQTELEKIRLQIKVRQARLEAVKIQNKNFTFIEVLQSPAASIHPVKANTKLNMLIGAIVGLSTTMFLAFLLDYIFKALNRKKLAGLPI